MSINMNRVDEYEEASKAIAKVNHSQQKSRC